MQVDGSMDVVTTNSSSSNAETTQSNQVQRKLRTEEGLAKFNSAIQLYETQHDLESSLKILNELVREPVISAAVKQAKTDFYKALNSDNIDQENGLEPAFLLAYSIYKARAKWREDGADKKLNDYLIALYIDQRDPSLWYDIGEQAYTIKDFSLSSRAFQMGWFRTAEFQDRRIGKNCLIRLIEMRFIVADFQSCIKYIKVAHSFGISNQSIQHIEQYLNSMDPNDPVLDKRDQIVQQSAWSSQRNLIDEIMESYQSHLQLSLEKPTLQCFCQLVSEFFRKASEGEVCGNESIGITVLETDIEGPETIRSIEDSNKDLDSNTKPSTESSSDFEEPVRSSGRLRFQKRTSDIHSHSSKNSGFGTLLDEVETGFDFLSEIDRTIAHPFGISKFETREYCSSHDQSPQSVLHQFSIALRRCIYTASKLMAPKSDRAARAKKRNNNENASQNERDLSEEAWNKYLASSSAKSRVLLDVLSKNNQKTLIQMIKATLLEHLYEKTEDYAGIIELCRLLSENSVHGDNWLEFVVADVEETQSIEFLLLLCEMNCRCLEHLAEILDVSTISKHCITKQLYELHYAFCVPIEKWITFSQNAKDFKALDLTLISSHLWTRYTVEKIFDIPLKEQEDLLKRCLKYLQDSPVQETTSSMKQVEISELTVEKEIKNLKAEQELSVIFHNFENLQSYDRVISQLEPVLLGTETHSLDRSLSKRVLHKQSYERKMDLYRILYDSAMNSRQSTKAYRCLTASIHLALQNLFKSDGYIDYFYENWTFFKENLEEYREQLLKICQETFNRLSQIWGLLDELLTNHLDNLWTSHPTDDERKLLFSDSLICVNLAWMICLYSESIREASSIMSAGSRLEGTAENPENPSGALVLSILKNSVRPWIVFYHFLVRMRKRPATEVVSSSVGSTYDIVEEASPLDFLVFAHSELGDRGLCQEDDSRLLLLIKDEALSWYSESQEIDMGSAQSPISAFDSFGDDFLQCFSCLYGINIPTRQRSIKDHYVESGNLKNLDLETVQKLFFYPVSSAIELAKAKTEINQLHKVFESFDTVLNPILNDHKQGSILVSSNYGVLLNSLDRDIDPTADLQPNCYRALNFTDIYFEDQGTKIPQCFRKYYYTKARFLVKAASLSEFEDSSDPVSSVLAAIENDIIFNPKRVESWYQLSLCYIALLKNQYDDERTYISILEYQRKSFWSLSHCLYLFNHYEKIKPGVEFPMKVSGSNFADKPLKLFYMYICCLSEMGHLLYQMGSLPIKGGALLAALENNKLRNAAIQEMVAPIYRKRSITEIDADSSIPSAPTDEKSSPVDTVLGVSKSSVEDEANQDFTETRAQAESLIEDSQIRRLLSLSAHFFVTALKIYKSCKKSIALGNFISRDSEVNRELEMLKNSTESWEWTFMLAKCSERLGREKDVVVKYYRKSASILRQEAKCFYNAVAHSNYLLATELSFFSQDKLDALVAKKIVPIDSYFHWLLFLQNIYLNNPAESLDWLDEQLAEIAKDLNLSNEDPPYIECRNDHENKFKICAYFRRIYFNFSLTHEWFYPAIYSYSKYLIEVAQHPSLSNLFLKKEELYDEALENLKKLFPFKIGLFQLDKLPFRMNGQFGVDCYDYANFFIELLTRKMDIETLQLTLKRLRTSEVFWHYELARKAFLPCIYHLGSQLEKLLGSIDLDKNWWEFPKKLPRITFHKTLSTIEGYMVQKIKAVSEGLEFKHEAINRIHPLNTICYPNLLSALELYKSIVDSTRRAASDAFRGYQVPEEDLELKQGLEKLDKCCIDLYCLMYTVLGVYEGLIPDRIAEIDSSKVSAVSNVDTESVKAPEETQNSNPGTQNRESPVLDSVPRSYTPPLKQFDTSIPAKQKLDIHFDKVIKGAISYVVRNEVPTPALKLKNDLNIEDLSGWYGETSANGTVETSTLLYRAGAFSRNMKSRLTSNDSKSSD